MRVRAALAAALAVAAALAAAPWSPAVAVTGRSNPVVDSYYPEYESAGIDVLSYDLSLRWAPATRTLRGSAVISARATADESSLNLALSHRLAVISVTLDGYAATVTHTTDTLAVQGTFTKDTVYALVVTYRGTPAAVSAPTQRSDLAKVGWHTRRNGGVWTMQEPFGAFTWYPVNDTPSDKAMYRVRVNVPDKWVGLFNGAMVHSSDRKGRRVTVFAPRHPLAPYLTTLAIGAYKRVATTAFDGTPVVLWIPKSHPGYAKLLDKTAADYRWLRARLGAYPFERVGVVVVPAKSAMETPELITLGSAILKEGKHAIRETVAHELSHAWFGDTATPSDWRDLWLNEGFATYYQARFTASHGWATWRGQVSTWKNWDQELRNEYGPPGAYQAADFASLNVYWCSARMLNRLARKVGRDRFPRLVRRWLATHHDTNVSRETFAAWWGARTGLPMASFLTTWLDSPTAPK